MPRPRPMTSGLSGAQGGSWTQSLWPEMQPLRPQGPLSESPDSDLPYSMHPCALTFIRQPAVSGRRDARIRLRPGKRTTDHRTEACAGPQGTHCAGPRRGPPPPRGAREPRARALTTSTHVTGPHRSVLSRSRNTYY